MSEQNQVLYNTVGHVATIVMNSPASRNAFNAALRKQLLAAFKEADADNAVRVIVLGGAGKGFCAGADLIEAQGNTHLTEQTLLQEYQPILQLIGTTDKIVICAVNGAAAGIGAALVMHADLAVMEKSAQLVMAFSGVGLVADGGAHQWLLDGLGYKRAYQLIVEGGRIDAESCIKCGFANKLCEDGDAINASQQWAAALSQRSPLSARHSKQILRSSRNAGFAEIFEMESAKQQICATSEDCQNAILAFAEKRVPTFEGR